MPLYQLQCINGHKDDVFTHVAKDYGCRTLVCPHCGHTMSRIFAVGTPLLWAEEGRPRILENMGPMPVTVTSHAHHQRLLKERGLEWAGQKRGRKGCWV